MVRRGESRVVGSALFSNAAKGNSFTAYGLQLMNLRASTRDHHQKAATLARPRVVLSRESRSAEA